jgi:transposase
MVEQHALAFPEPAPAGPLTTVFVNARCQIQTVEGQRVVVVAGAPIHRFAAEDTVAAAYAAVLLVDSGFALQQEVADAFGCDVRTVRRDQQRYAEGGMASLAKRAGWRPGRRRLHQGRAAAIRRLHAQGDSNRKIARQLGVTENAIRKQVGPTERQIQTELPELSLPPAPAAPEAAPAPAAPEAAPAPAAPETASASAASETASAPAAPEAAPSSPPLPAPPRDALDEPAGLSFATDPTDRTVDRLLARLGLLDDAPPCFGNATAVPGAGVLFALPALVYSGIFQAAQQLYGRLGPAFYGLRTTVLTFLLMALWRLKRPEALKEHDPAALGQVLGLDRAPEVKTLRRRLAQLAARHQAEALGAELARLRVEQRGRALGFLYVDGHVRVYHGKHTLPKAHVARMRLALPATTDYWINDQTGDPLLVITAPANAGMVKMLLPITAEIRALLGERRVTIVFDRGGWSPKLFQSLIAQGFDILTYRKGQSRAITAARFVERSAVLDGRQVTYRLYDQAVRFLKGKLRLRQVTRLSDDGHQTQVLTSCWDLPDLEVAFRMFERWRQENFFKYMREEFLLDALVDYQVEPDDPTRTVPNPARRALDKPIRAARAEVAELEQQYGAAALENPEAERPTMRGFKIAHGKLGKQLRAARERLQALREERLALPARVEVRETTTEAVIRLASERQHLTSLFKMLAYQAESDLLALLRPHYARADDEGRTLIHELLRASADLTVGDGELLVTLRPLSAPHRTLAIQAICETLNAAQIGFPGSQLRLRYAVAAPPCRSMAFPGPRRASEVEPE